MNAALNNDIESSTMCIGRRNKDKIAIFGFRSENSIKNNEKARGKKTLCESQF